MTRFLVACALLCSIGAISAQTPSGQATEPSARPTERVDGIGGFFFRAKSPQTLAKWYSDNLGVGVTPQEYNGGPWQQTAGPTAFQPFPANTKYFGDAQNMWMLNFRVRDLDAMVAQLRKAGIKVDVDPMTYPNGRFASLQDPEGNPIQLWQPQRKAS